MNVPQLTPDKANALVEHFDAMLAILGVSPIMEQIKTHLKNVPSEQMDTILKDVQTKTAGAIAITMEQFRNQMEAGMSNVKFDFTKEV